MRKIETGFAKRLELIRKEKGLSKVALGRLIGHSVERISQFESGKREPSIAELIKLCGALNVSADALLGIPGISYIK